MKNILVILDGIVAKKLLARMISSNVAQNNYDIVYMDDLILPNERPSNFTFYKFDPTSISKLFTVLSKDFHNEVLIALTTKEETLSTIKNIRAFKKKLQVTIYNNWDINISNDTYLGSYNGLEVLANGLLEKLPNIPVVAQNIGLREGEIMEIRVPFGSSYAYRYIGSIVQTDWKIFGLYRNDQLIPIRPSLVIKPYDIILIIGNPKVLMQVYGAVTKTQGRFPMPFGSDIYLYIDLLHMSEKETLHCIEQAKLLHKKLKNKQLIIKVTKPTNAPIMAQIKNSIKDIKNIELEIDYHSLGFRRILLKDTKRYNIGMLVFSCTLLRYKEATHILLDLKIPIFKITNEPLVKIKRTVLFLGDTGSYEQISPVIFDISGQVKNKIKIFNLDPLETGSKETILEHFESLSKIFNLSIEVISSNKNPIKELVKQQNALQVLPLKKAMFKKRRFRFLSTDSDLLSYDMESLNQLLIPIIEN